MVLPRVLRNQPGNSSKPGGQPATPQTRWVRGSGFEILPAMPPDQVPRSEASGCFGKRWHSLNPEKKMLTRGKAILAYRLEFITLSLPQNRNASFRTEWNWIGQDKPYLKSPPAASKRIIDLSWQCSWNNHLNPNKTCFQSPSTRPISLDPHLWEKNAEDNQQPQGRVVCGRLRTGSQVSGPLPSILPPMLGTSHCSHSKNLHTHGGPGLPTQLYLSPPGAGVLKLFSILRREQDTQWLTSILAGKWLTADSFWRAELIKAERRLWVDVCVMWRKLEKEKQARNMEAQQHPSALQKMSFHQVLPGRVWLQSQDSTRSHSSYISVLTCCYKGPNLPNLVFKQYICVQDLGQNLASELQVTEHVQHWWKHFVKQTN